MSALYNMLHYCNRIVSDWWSKGGKEHVADTSFFLIAAIVTRPISIVARVLQRLLRGVNIGLIKTFVMKSYYGTFYERVEKFECTQSVTLCLDEHSYLFGFSVLPQQLTAE